MEAYALRWVLQKQVRPIRVGLISAPKMAVRHVDAKF